MLRTTILTLAFWLSAVACQGTRPDNLGVHEGQLQPCPDKPNCVSSQASNIDQNISPLPGKGSSPETMQRLVQVVKGMPRSNIVLEKDDYLYVEFTSAFFRFVDDAEFYLPKGQNQIQTRSASRLGKSDFGVNRKRIEAIRQELEKPAQ